jgi:uncharacterized protein (DUF2062 family)
MIWSPRALYRKLAELMSLDDPPWRIALGLAIGIFVSCTPFYGLHTLLAIVVATIVRVNRAVTVTGAWINLPWFAPFLYGVSLRLGEVVLTGERRPPAERVPWATLGGLLWPPYSWTYFTDTLAAYSDLLFAASKALLLGCLLVGLLAGTVTYVIALAAIRELRREQTSHDRPARDTRAA